MIFNANITRLGFLRAFGRASQNVNKSMPQNNSECQEISDLHDIEKFRDLGQNDEDKNKISSIVVEYELWKLKEKYIPENLDMEHMKHLMVLPSKNQRHKYLNFLFRKECHEMAKCRKKAKKREVRLNRTPEEISHIRYGVYHNSLFRMISKSKINKLYNQRLSHLMLFSQSIVLDLDYDEFMVGYESNNCAYQLTLINAINKQHSNPYNLHFCNADCTKQTVQFLEKRLKNLRSDDCLINCTPSSYLDLFPKENLVYLSPHSDEVMKSYDHKAIYIIGAFVDKRHQSPVSFAKAKREGLRTCRLPLDDYVQWRLGTKSLTLDQMLNILLELKTSNDWTKALRFVPSRKIKNDSVEEHSTAPISE